MEIFETGILAQLILLGTQMALKAFPRLNPRATALVVTVLFASVAIYVSDGITIIEAFLAFAAQVIFYDFAVKPAKEHGKEVAFQNVLEPDIFQKIIRFTGLNDKVLHLIAGFLIATASLIFFRDPWVCFGIAMTAGLAKEIYDLYHDGVADWMDWFATIGGGLVFVIMHAILT
jgi:hypothetical protein